MSADPTLNHPAVIATEAASAAFQEGDPGPLIALFADSDEIVVFGAKGGVAKGPEAVRRVTAGAARALAASGGSRYDILASQFSGDLGYVAGLQHLSSTTEGPLTFRVTLVFARREQGWRLLVRHADELVGSPFLMEEEDAHTPR